jgi:hypothetical protein
MTKRVVENFKNNFGKHFQKFTKQLFNLLTALQFWGKLIKGPRISD